VLQISGGSSEFLMMLLLSMYPRGITEEEAWVPLAAVRDLRPQLRLETIEEIGAFEQDLLAES